MADAPEWPAPEELAAAKKPQENTPARPAPGTPDNNNAKLLTRIDKQELPEGYQGNRHQAYVDRVMAGLKPEQRARVGQFWKEKRRLQPKMENAGMSFVRILEYVARGEKLSAQPAPQPTPPRPEPKGRPVVSKIDPQGLNWYQWRGPEANGVSRTANPPLQWSEDRNVKWKVAIEGQGNASPIIWGDKIFLLTGGQHRPRRSEIAQTGRPTGTCLRHQVPQYGLQVRSHLPRPKHGRRNLAADGSRTGSP